MLIVNVPEVRRAARDILAVYRARVALSDRCGTRPPHVADMVSQRCQHMQATHAGAVQALVESVLDGTLAESEL